MAPSEQTIVLREDDVAWREVDGSAVVLDLKGAEYSSINETGTVLWRMIAEGTTRTELVERLVAEHGIDATRAGADVDEFLSSCVDKGLVLFRD